MKVFEKPNLEHGWKCPICKKSDEKQVVLIGIAGTEKHGIIECEQFHLDCIELFYHKEHNCIGATWTDG